MAIFANTTAALRAAKAASDAGLPYSSAIAQSGVMAGFRQDCSGFADYILSKSGVNVGGATTVGFPSYFKKGYNPSGITLWDIPKPGQAGHVVVDIAGQWYESGGIGGGGPRQITPHQAALELGVPSVNRLGNRTTPRGFTPYEVPSQQTSLERLWIEAGGPPAQAKTAAAVALAESGGKVDATNKDANGTTDYGLWQINSVHSQFDTQKLLNDPLYNAQAAVAVWKSSGWDAWSTYKSGAFRQFLSQAGSASINYGGPNGGYVRPGGGAGGGGSSSDPNAPTGSAITALQNYEDLRDTPRVGAPQTTNPFHWFWASFTGNWDKVGT